MIRLILVRHGQTKANVERRLQGQSDGTLTDVGRQQAEELALHLKNMEIDKVLSSDLIRAKDTANAIAKYHNLEVEAKSILREWNCGNLDGTSAEALKIALSQSDQPLPDFRPEGGETLREVQRRAEIFLEEVETNYEGLRVLVCSHGDFIRMLMSKLLQIKIEEANGIHLDNASYSVFERNDGEWRNLEINKNRQE